MSSACASTSQVRSWIMKIDFRYNYWVLLATIIYMSSYSCEHRVKLGADLVKGM